MKQASIAVVAILGIGILIGFSVLMYTPELGHAEQVSTDDGREKRTLANIEYMQDVTTDICTNTPEADAAGNHQYQLKDSRDQKIYWVAKLKDGNCWMTQNLAYVDKDSSYASPSNWGGYNDRRRYYNPGLYVYITPTVQNNCGTSNISSLDSCISKGWMNVAGWTPSDDPNYSNVVDATNKIYNAHYLVGNYYSYTAAAAGSAPSAAGTASSSICPTGWQLPTSNSTTVSKSFGHMLTQYGLQSNITTDSYDIRLAPLYFVYGGDVNYNSLYDAGKLGSYWSSMTNNEYGAYILRFDTGVYPSATDNRYFGFSVRCVLSGGEKRNYDNVEIMVNPTISLEVAEEVTVEKSEANPSTAELDVKVSSNQPYTVAISSNDPVMRSSMASVTIPAKSGLLNTAENGWGVKLKESSEFFTAVTNDLQTFYTASGAEMKTIPFTIGISTAPDIPNGEYSTDITVTATQN